MSSPKSAAAKSAAKNTAAKPARAKPVQARPTPVKQRIIPAAAKPKPLPETPLGAEAARLAAEIERIVADGKLDGLSPEAAQPLMAALCKLYTAHVEEGSKSTPVVEGQIVSPTAIMVTASGLLRAANLAVFELGMWQSWTGR